MYLTNRISKNMLIIMFLAAQRDISYLIQNPIFNLELNEISPETLIITYFYCYYYKFTHKQWSVEQEPFMQGTTHWEIFGTH